MTVTSPFALASKPGTWSATRSVKRKAPRSARSHSALAVMTLVFEYKSHSVSSRAETRVPSVRASPSDLKSLVLKLFEEVAELAPPSDRDLGPGIAALGDVARDHLHEALQRLGIEAQRRRIGDGQREGHGVLARLKARQRSAGV